MRTVLPEPGVNGSSVRVMVLYSCIGGGSGKGLSELPLLAGRGGDEDVQPATPSLECDTAVRDARRSASHGALQRGHHVRRLGSRKAGLRQQTRHDLPEHVEKRLMI